METKLSSIFREMALRSGQPVQLQVRWDDRNHKLRLNWTDVTPSETEMLQLKMIQSSLEELTGQNVHFRFSLKGHWIEYYFDHGGYDLHLQMEKLSKELNEKVWE